MLKSTIAALLLTAASSAFAQSGPQVIPAESGVFTFNTDATFLFGESVPFYGTVHPEGQPSCFLYGRMRAFVLPEGPDTQRKSELILEPGSTYISCSGAPRHLVFGSFRINKGNLGWVPPQTPLTRATGSRSSTYVLIGTRVEPNTYGYWETWQDYAPK